MSKKKGPKPEFVQVNNPKPCPTELYERHILSFVDSFIDPKKKDRYRSLLAPSKPPSKSFQTYLPLDKRFTSTLKGQDAFPQNIRNQLGGQEGVYYEVGDGAWLLTVQQACSLHNRTSPDAIFSLIPGQLAINFTHHGDVILCKK